MRSTTDEPGGGEVFVLGGLVQKHRSTEASSGGAVEAVKTPYEELGRSRPDFPPPAGKVCRAEGVLARECPIKILVASDPKPGDRIALQ